MRRHSYVLLTLAAVLTFAVTLIAGSSSPDTIHTTQYKVLAPITQGNLTVFPVVAASTHDTSWFMTLDDGLRSGEVVVTEAGRVAGLVRRPGIVHSQAFESGARVNQLVLVNNSKRPLLLLAGEIVTGGKQDRVIGKDRIVPVGADPIDLNVFCVEPGRWTETSANFMTKDGAAAMAAPSVRKEAMASQNQQKVWDSVNKSNNDMKENLSFQTATPGHGAGVAGGVVAGAIRDLSNTTSYATVMGNDVVKHQVESVAAPVVQSYQQVIRELRDRNAVGVVVAVNGRIIWADIFASTELLQKYWPKLARSYAAEAMTQRASKGSVDVGDAEKFLASLDGRHEVVDSEPQVYRHTEITGDGFKAFELTSLLPKTGFDLHIAKMSQ